MIAPRGKPDKHRFDNLDFSGIRFPSDSLTIGALRRQHRGSFDVGFDHETPRFFYVPRGNGHATDTIALMLSAERFIATAAFAKAAGIEPPDLFERSGAIEELVEQYK